MATENPAACLCAVAVLGFALSLTSCANETDGPASGIGLADAKANLLSVQDQIVELVPENLVIAVFQNDTSSLMSCRGGEKKWTGDAEVQMTSGVDRELLRFA